MIIYPSKHLHQHLCFRKITVFRTTKHVKQWLLMSCIE